MMTLLTSGKQAAGKQNLIKEVLILPQPGTPMKKVLCLKLTTFDSLVFGLNYQAFYHRSKPSWLENDSTKHFVKRGEF